MGLTVKCGSERQNREELLGRIAIRWYSVTLREEGDRPKKPDNRSENQIQAAIRHNYHSHEILRIVKSTLNGFSF